MGLLRKQEINRAHTAFAVFDQAEGAQSGAWVFVGAVGLVGIAGGDGQLGIADARGITIQKWLQDALLGTAELGQDAAVKFVARRNLVGLGGLRAADFLFPEKNP